MKKIILKLKKRSYGIVIAKGIINSIGPLLKKLDVGRDAIIITNPLVKKHFGLKVARSLKKARFSVKFQVVADTERSKSIASTFRVINSIAKYDVKKQLFIVALGGGVIGDLAGFVAAIYRRGIPYVQVPTTLLAQVDSAIGGKVAIDLSYGKNLVGAFYQPRLVISDISALKSLSRRQIKAGLAEVIKYGVIKDKGLFVYLEKNISRLLKQDARSLESIIYKCSLIKSRVVEQDEKEKKGIRTILNFGHTIGHAIEAASKYYSYNHGEAVALGMICAARISQKLGFLSRQSSRRIEDLVCKAGLPNKIRRVKLASILSAHLHDKKFFSDRNRFVLPTRIGKVSVCEKIPLGVIKSTIKERLV